VVTRIPEYAALIEQAPSVYVHFSLDRHSLGRRHELLKHRPKTDRYFFSYQCDKGERPDSKTLHGMKVLFFDNYQPTMPLKKLPREVVCPLNRVQDIAGVCERCRRCFSDK
jgi:hypothetical protein